MEYDSFADTLEDLIHDALRDVSSYHETMRQTTTAIQDDDSFQKSKSDDDDDSYERQVNDDIMSSLQQKFELLSIREEIELTTNRMDILMNDILRNNVDNNHHHHHEEKKVSSSSLSFSDEEDGMKHEWKQLKHIEATLGEELKMNGSKLSTKSHNNKQVDAIQYIMQHVIPKCCNKNTTMEEMVQAIFIIGQIIAGGIYNIQSLSKLKEQNKPLKYNIDLEEQQQQQETYDGNLYRHSHDNNQDPIEKDHDDKSFLIYTRIIILQILRLQYLVIKFILFHRQQKQIQRQETNLFQQIVGWSWDRVTHPIETIQLAWNGIHWGIHSFQKHQHNIVNILHSSHR